MMLHLIMIAIADYYCKFIIITSFFLPISLFFQKNVYTTLIICLSGEYT